MIQSGRRLGVLSLPRGTWPKAVEVACGYIDHGVGDRTSSFQVRFPHTDIESGRPHSHWRPLVFGRPKSKTRVWRHGPNVFRKTLLGAPSSSLDLNFRRRPSSASVAESYAIAAIPARSSKTPWFGINWLSLRPVVLLGVVLPPNIPSLSQKVVVACPRVETAKEGPRCDS